MQMVILTDLHLVPEGTTLYGLDPRQRLRQALQTIVLLHANAELLVITGDLAEKGSEEVYRILRQELAAWPGETLLLLGNHDFRQPFLSVFPEARDARGGFVQAKREYDAATLVALDTLDETVTNGTGWLCPERLAFARDALAGANREKPLLLFQHHPPFPVGLRSMDNIALRNGEEWRAAIENARRPDYMFFGHLHRPIAGLWRGMPFHIQRGLSHQVGFDLHGPVLVPGTHEPPCYSLVTVENGAVTIHKNEFLYCGPQFLLDDRHAKAALNLTQPGPGH